MTQLTRELAVDHGRRGPDVAHPFAAGLAVTSIQSVLPSLEDVFLDVVERAGQQGAA